MTPVTGLRRTELSGATDDRLFFAQVREDPLLEIEALGVSLDGTIVIISSGGCTALSLVAVGAKDVVAVDLNRTQNHMVELKAAALAGLEIKDVWAFVGATDAPERERLRLYDLLRDRLSPAAATYWDAHRKAIGNGAITAGATDQMVRVLSRGIRRFVHPGSRIDALLACETLAEQQALYRRDWDSKRWRALFKVFFNRAVFRKVYNPGFFEHVENDSFSAHFLHRFEHAVTRLPVRTNYALHEFLRGGYPVAVEGGVPPYLDAANADAIRDVGSSLALVDGTISDYLKSLPDRSVAGFALSNICEWLNLEQIDELLAEIVRTARPGARVCIRNFLGWTEVPARWRATVVIDEALSKRLTAQDRALSQAQFLVGTIRGE